MQRFIDASLTHPSVNEFEDDRSVRRCCGPEHVLREVHLESSRLSRRLAGNEDVSKQEEQMLTKRNYLRSVSRLSRRLAGNEDVSKQEEQMLTKRNYLRSVVSEAMSNALL